LLEKRSFLYLRTLVILVSLSVLLLIPVYPVIEVSCHERGGTQMPKFRLHARTTPRASIAEELDFGARTFERELALKAES
jgi:hypothetical protein